MKYLSSIRSILFFLCLFFSLIGSTAYADRTGSFEASLIIPYFNGKNIDFDNGTAVDFNSDPGFGFGFAYNYSDRLAGRADFTFNSISYDAERVLDDGAQTVDLFGSSVDSFSARMGVDYYLSSGNIAPFVSANIGWNFIDTNVISGPPGSVCWWDPWWGYICDSYVPTYTENSLTYGAGLGLRFDVSRSSFVRLGYYLDYVDFDGAAGSVDFDSFRLEIGFNYD